MKFIAQFLLIFLSFNFYGQHVNHYNILEKYNKSSRTYEKVNSSVVWDFKVMDTDSSIILTDSATKKSTSFKYLTFKNDRDRNIYTAYNVSTNQKCIFNFYENDGFSIKNGQPEHIVNSFKDRGILVGAFCALYKKNQQMPFFVMVKLDEYNKGQSNWKTMPDTMIKKVAEAQALRGAYQGIFRGTYDESEIFEAKVINQESEELKMKRIELSKLISECQDSAITDIIVDEVTTAESEGKLTIENYDKWIARFK